MVSAPCQMPLLPPPPFSGIAINSKCILDEEDGVRVVLLHGVPVFYYDVDDKQAEDLWLVQALEAGYATVSELTTALPRNRRSLHRLRRRYADNGAAGLMACKRGPKGPRFGQRQEALVRKLHDQGVGVRAMARRLHVSPPTVLLVIRRLGLTRPTGATQQNLPVAEPHGASPVPTTEPASPATEPASPATEPASPATEPASPATEPASPATEPASPTTEPAPLETTEPDADLPLPLASLDTDPRNRGTDRLMASLGLLDDAAPVFASGTAVPRAGVLLALPVLVQSGLLQTAHQVYRSIGPAFYGLRTILVAFVMFALLRVKRAENIKEYAPPDLGRILGLDRAPEVKTLRRKLRELAEDEHAEDFLKRLVARRVQSQSDALGYLYVDGHVRVYHGQAELPKTHACRLRLSLPATQDVWLNDARTCPVFVVTQTAHPQLVSALPPVLQKVRSLVGQRRVTVVFDRGGWSPKLFQQMDRDGFDVLTYYKGALEPIPEDQFDTYTVSTPRGPVTYELHHRSIALLDGTFWMRMVVRKQGTHQTAIVTTRQDLDIQEVAQRMFGRWGQENFFKYMRQEFALDALVQYGTEPADPGRLVPNPARKALDKQLAQVRKEQAALEAAYGAAAVDNQETERPTMRGFKIAHGAELGIPLRQARAKADQLRLQRRQVPTHVPIGQLKQQVVQLPVRRKRFSDALKMLAYQIETDLLRVVQLLYPRSRDEGRRLLVAAFQSAADLEVTQQELRVTLAPQSSPHRTEVVAALCELLNDTQTCYPGTTLRLRFAIHRAPGSFEPGG